MRFLGSNLKTVTPAAEPSRTRYAGHQDAGCQTSDDDSWLPGIAGAGGDFAPNLQRQIRQQEEVIASQREAIEELRKAVPALEQLVGEQEALIESLQKRLYASSASANGRDVEAAFEFERQRRSWQGAKQQAIDRARKAETVKRRRHLSVGLPAKAAPQKASSTPSRTLHEATWHATEHIFASKDKLKKRITHSLAGLKDALDRHDERINKASTRLPDTSTSGSSSTTLNQPQSRSTTYRAAVSTWEEAEELTLPKEMWLHNAGGAIAQIGPLAVAARNLKEQCTEMEQTLKTGNAFHVDKYIMTRLGHHLKELHKQRQSVEARLEAAFVHYNDVTHLSASAVAPRMTRDARRYDQGLHELTTAEPKMLEAVNELIEKLANTGELTAGEVVEVIHDNRIKSAKVLRALPADANATAAANGDANANAATQRYEVSVWNEFAELGHDYECGFDTRLRVELKLIREQIYANRKHSQVLSAHANSAWVRRQAAAGAAQTGGVQADGNAAAPTPDCTSLEYLMLLYYDAERTLDFLESIKTQLEERLNDQNYIVIAPLKGLSRAVIKALEKYKGDYSRLTDLARMTVGCSSIKWVLGTLRAIASLQSVEIILIKNRLMEQFAASATGGYRDLLLNLRCAATGHIFELQVTLMPLLAVKSSGGHASYSLARQLKLFEPEVARHEGALSERVLRGVASGLIRALVCRSPAAALTTHFDGLIKALSSPSCAVTELSLEGCDWPDGRGLHELLAPLMRLGDLLTKLNVAAMNVEGSLPEEFFEKCTRLYHCGFYQLPNLNGPIPRSIGKMQDLHTVWFTGSSFCGELPVELGQCSSLERFWVIGNKMSGAVPAEAFAPHRAMTELGLSKNDELYVTTEVKQAIEKGVHPKANLMWPDRIVES
mmetsp:Transcript_1000/g.2047  ORF Transcript_1000/g.2047 Transcript_1000/m.2047 type:complete len:893 (-) Transcript_1000:161-2839(-)